MTWSVFEGKEDSGIREAAGWQNPFERSLLLISSILDSPYLSPSHLVTKWGPRRQWTPDF